MGLDEETQRLLHTVHSYLFGQPDRQPVDVTVLQSDIRDVLMESYHCSAELFNKSLPFMGEEIFTAKSYAILFLCDYISAFFTLIKKQIDK